MDQQKFSKRYYRREYLLSKMKVPTQTEVRQQLGGPLSEVFFKSLPPPERVLMGTDRPLEGPKTELWISPSDQLIGKVLLRAPLTTKYIKALTHEGIIEIGGEIEKKRIEEAQRALELAVADNEDLMKFLAARQLEESMAEAKSKQDQNASELEKQCAEKIEVALRELEERLLKEMADVIEAEQRKCAEEKQVLEKRLLEAQEDRENLEIEHEEELERAIKQTRQGLEDELANERSRCNRDMSLATHYRLESLRSQRHAMECTHVAELMCALCSERSRCADTLSGVKNMYEQQVSLLQKKLTNADQSAKTIVKPNEHYEQRIRSIVKQFQKFINFALSAVPSQAEFLLSLEKLMVVQMSDAILQQPEEIKQQVEVPYVPETQQDDRKQFVKRIRNKRDKSVKPFLLYDDALPGGRYMRLLEEEKLDPPYIVVGGHKYAEPKYWDQVRKLTQQVEWEAKNEGTEQSAAAEESKPEEQATASAAVQTKQYNWCSLEYEDIIEPEINTSNVRFSIVPEALFKYDTTAAPFKMDDAEIPDEVLDTEQIISTTDAEPHQDQVDSDEILPIVPKIESEDEIEAHVASPMPLKQAVSSEDYFADTGEDQMLNLSDDSPPPDYYNTPRLSKLSYTKNSLELLQGSPKREEDPFPEPFSEQPRPASGHRKSKLLETKNSLEIFKEKLPILQKAETELRKSMDSVKPLVRDSLEVLGAKEVIHPPAPLIMGRELSKLNLNKQPGDPRDSLEIRYSKLVQSKASKDLETDAEVIEVVPIGGFCKLRQGHWICTEKEGDDYFGQDRFQIGLNKEAAYMTLDPNQCDIMEGGVTNEYEKCTEFEYKLLLSGLTKEDVKDIPHPETCDLMKVAAEISEKKAKKDEGSTDTFVLWNPYDTDLADFYRTEFKKQNIVGSLPHEYAKRAKTAKTRKSQSATDAKIETAPKVCKYPHMFDLNKLAYDRHFGRTSSVIDRNLQVYRALLPKISEEKDVKVKASDSSVKKNIIDMSDETIRKVVQDLANGSDSHLHQKVYNILTSDNYKKMKIRSLLNLIKKYPSLAELFGKSH